MSSSLSKREMTFCNLCSSFCTSLSMASLPSEDLCSSKVDCEILSSPPVFWTALVKSRENLVRVRGLGSFLGFILLSVLSSWWEEARTCPWACSSFLAFRERDWFTIYTIILQASCNVYISDISLHSLAKRSSMSSMVFSSKIRKIFSITKWSEIFVHSVERVK